MMIGYGSGWGLVVGLLWLAGMGVAVALVIVLIVRAAGGDGRGPGGGDEAEAILRGRLARGEITPEEYERLRAVLGPTVPSRSPRPAVIALIVIVVLLVIALLVGAWGGMNGWGPMGSGPYGWMGPMMGWGVTPDGSPVAGDAVSIAASAFSPADLLVKAGTTVTWTNRDALDHAVGAPDGSWASGDLAAGASFRQTFSTPGTYRYLCLDHPWMRGTVTVQP